MYIKHFYAGYSQMYNYNEYIIVYLFKEIGITDQAQIYKRFKWGQEKGGAIIILSARRNLPQKSGCEFKEHVLKNLFYGGGGGWIIFVK